MGDVYSDKSQYDKVTVGQILSSLHSRSCSDSVFCQILAAARIRDQTEHHQQDVQFPTVTCRPGVCLAPYPHPRQGRPPYGCIRAPMIGDH